MTNTQTWLKRTIALATVGIAALAAGAPSAKAGTLTSNFTVQTTVNTACTAFTTPTLTFPSYVSGQTGLDTASTTFSITCPGATAAVPENVNVSFTGQGGATSFTMVNGANNLPYSLCQDSGCTQPFTFATAGNTFQITQATATPYVVYGQIAAGITVPTGNYAQTLTANLNF